MKEFFEKLKNRIYETLNDETKRYLKIFGIWYFITLFLSLLFILLKSLNNFGIGETLYELAFAIFYPFGIIIVFLPAIFALKFLFGKIHNIFARMVLTGVIIPCTNAVYFLLGENVPSIDLLSTIALITGFLSLFWIIPTTFFVALFIPKKLLPSKFACAGTLALMEVFGLPLAMQLLNTYLKIID